MSFSFDPLGAFNAFADYWRWGVHVQRAWAAPLSGADGIARLRRRRLDELLVHAHAESAFYRRHHHEHAAARRELSEYAPVDKPTLMAHFDEWVTDPNLRYEAIEKFIRDPQRIGEPYLGRYAVWTSSGSTGRPGVFVQDEEALAIYDALLSTRFPSSGAAVSPFQTLATGGRFAMIAALGGHFAGVVSWERLRREYPWLRAVAKTFSVLSPIRELVAQLNEFRPSVLASYPTTLLLLAREREAGRLRLQPRALWSGGETLAEVERAEIAKAFDCAVIDGYGASECLNIAYDCGHGSLHLNSDWVILEPIDANGRPVPPGELSTSVLLTNLANRVQPLIRYDLGDSVRFRLQPCDCGSPFPAIEVEGRRDDIVSFTNDDGETVPMPPLALATVVEEGAGVHRFQVLQTGERTLHVRFEPAHGERRDAVWARIEHCLRDYLARQGLHRIKIQPDDAPPQADPVSGKLREVLGLNSARSAAGRPRAGRRKNR
jgi:phenylacetate-coenzyme A ligase PaaK-like adenylate-forming protein